MSRAACAVVLALVVPVAIAGTGAQDAKAQVDGIKQQTAEQATAVAQMQKQVQSLESQGKQADQALGEKDKAIADLERQLRDAEATKAPAATKASGK